MQAPNRIELFDQWAKSYDNSILDKSDFPFTGYEQILERVVRLADAKPNMRVLDIGIGTGNLAAHFVNAGCEVWGLDFSAEMLTQTQAKLPQAKLVQANLLGDWTRELQLPFDRVVSAYVFHEFELETKMRLLRQITSECLSPDGSILVADIAFPSVDLRITASQQWANGWDTDEFYWAADESVLACKQVGLQATYEQVSSCGGVFTFARA
jgi:putative AdoMet-dependent methyltransferase